MPSDIFSDCSLGMCGNASLPESNVFEDSGNDMPELLENDDFAMPEDVGTDDDDTFADPFASKRKNRGKKKFVLPRSSSDCSCSKQCIHKFTNQEDLATKLSTFRSDLEKNPANNKMTGCIR